MVRDILKEMNLDEKTFQPRSVLAVISHSKDQYESIEDFAKRAEAANDWRMKDLRQDLRRLREKAPLRQRPGLDDIIFHTVTLLRQEPEVLDYYQHKFRYVLVDEYQDTNTCSTC